MAKDPFGSLIKEISETAAERVARLGPEAYAPPVVRRVWEDEPLIKEPNSWLKDMAKCLLDARYGELISLADGITKSIPGDGRPGLDINIDVMAKAIHTWAKNYVGE